MSQNRHGRAATQTRSFSMALGLLMGLSMALGGCGAPGVEAREASAPASPRLAYETPPVAEDETPRLAALGHAVAPAEPVAADAASTNGPAAPEIARGVLDAESQTPEPAVDPEWVASASTASVPAEPSVEAPARAHAFFEHEDAPIRRGLAALPVTEVERGRGGRSLGFRVTFEDGSRGYFKPDQAFNGMSWNAEIAAYHLDRELGFGRVAPVVSRRIEWSTLEDAAGRDGRVEELHVGEDGALTGAVIWWVPERLVPVSLPDGWQRWLRVEGSPAVVTPFQRPGTYRRAVAERVLTPMPAAPTPDIEERPGQLSDLIVFDYLTNNLDRWGGHNTNIRTVGAGGPLMYLDNAAAFTLRRPRNSMMDRRLHEVQRFRRSTIDAIRALDVEAYGARINADAHGPLLEPLHLANLETRRRHLLEYVDGLVEAHGEDAVRLLSGPLLRLRGAATVGAMRISILLALSVFALACTTRTEPSDGGSGDGGGGPCLDGELLCGTGETVQRCVDGERVDQETCTGDQVCAEGLGCVTCRPGYFVCNGSDLFECNAAGSGYDLSLSCTAEEVCVAMGPLGRCNNACAEAVANRSNLGCEYWAVDLDNENSFNGSSNAWEEQFAVAIANPSDTAATVRVFLNDAALGAPPIERQVFQGVVPPQQVREIELPTREVDGPIPSNADDRGTWTSPHAFRITSNFPVVAYQFNPIVQSFSNDASLLIPQSGLDNDYRVLGWPTANPIEPLGDIEGVPDRSFVTIVGTEDGTTVNVTAGGPIVGDNYGLGIGPAETGETITRTINRYEVLNLESDGRIGEATLPGDLTGTVVVSSAPVAVFSGGERGIAPVDRSRIPAPPGGIPERSCCTEHLEEQVFPTSAWGRDFVMTRSPVRGATWDEPDIYRVIADREGATITTNLPAPDDSFTLAAGEWREFYSQRSFIMQSSAPVSIEQILVSQGWVDEWTDGNGGDPSMILYPPFQQHREDYLFLTPSTFSADYVVIAMPNGTSVLLDGGDINGDEFMSLCTYEDAGTLDGTAYQAVTCPVEDGPHRVEADQPVGIMIYGYYSVGSYGYAGGTDLERINPLI